MFKNPFSFEGRIRRTEYGLSLIIATVGRVLIYFILSGVSRDAVFIVNLIFQAPLLWFFWAQGAKRCHDFRFIAPDWKMGAISQCDDCFHR